MWKRGNVRLLKQKIRKTKQKVILIVELCYVYAYIYDLILMTARFYSDVSVII